MLKTFDPRYQVPSRNFFSETLIPQLYQATKEKLVEQLNQAYYVSLTTDGWTSRNNASYITVTAHWLDATWKICSAVLQTTQLSQSHTAENLLAYLNNTVSTWPVTKVNSFAIMITTDNASNIVKAVKDGGFINIRCFAHTLNLAAQKGLADSNVAAMLMHIRRLVKFFRKSPAAAAMLSGKQSSLNLPLHTLILDCPTRWNSAFDMLQRFKDQYNAIHAVLYDISCRLKQSDVTELRKHLSKVDCDVMEKVIVVMKPLKEATEAVSSESKLRISSIHPMKHFLIRKLQPLDTDDTLTLSLKRCMSDDLRLRYIEQDQNNLLLMATALDPRFKQLSYLSRNEVTDIHKSIVEETIKLVCSPKAVEEAVASVSAASQSNATVEESTHLTPYSFMDEIFLSDLDSSEDTTTQDMKGQIDLEMQMYKQMPTLPRSQDPLQWWFKQQKHFMNLSKLATIIFTAMPSSVPSERVFSKAGELVSAKRSSLQEEHVDQLIFLNKNMI